jgi:DNA-binding NtrC family response regulator
MSTETKSLILRAADGATIRLARAFLLVQAGPEEGLEYELKDRPVVIGRGDSADLQLDDPTVSREHARLEPDGAGWRIKDLDSKGGTRVNGIQVQDAVLAEDAEIQMGSSLLVIRRSEVEVSAPKEEGGVFEGILGQSQAMRELFGVVKKLGPVDLPVLLVGESGTGKERLARAIHRHSPQSNGPYEVVDCTILGEGVHMRSELFGHVKGAFTGADRARDGAFVRANGGTLFLDEVGELPDELQPQLLRVLQEGEVRPLGSNDVQRVRVRVVSATNRDLGAMVAGGKFRQDLFYRLSALSVDVPPLRDRGDDVLLLAKHFLPDDVDLDASAVTKLKEYSWPGNVRELEFTMQQAGALCQGGVVTADDLRLRPVTGTIPVVRPDVVVSKGAGGVAPPPSIASGGDPFESSRQRVSRLTSEDIKNALAQTGGNRNEAAKLLGIGRATLFRLLKKMRDDDDDGDEAE